MLMCYGFIEVQALYEQYVRAFGEISVEDFKRNLYLRGSFSGRAVTGGLDGKTENEPWAAMSSQIVEQVTKTIMEAESTGGRAEGEAAADEYRKARAAFGYAEFTRKQILEMTRYGYTAVYPQWDILLEALYHLDIGLEDWEAEEILDEWYDQVQEGAGMKELLSESEEVKEDIGSGEWTLMEHALCRCWLETGIPQLKGNSRLEIAKKTGQNVFAVASEDGYELPGYQKRNLNSGPDAGTEPIIDPDDFCPCGSGKRYRQCCGRKKS